MTEFVSEGDYLDSQNPARALHAAYDVIWALRRGDIDWSLRREEIALAFQVLCDAPGGSPSFAYQSIALAQPDLREPHRWEGETQKAKAVRRACDLTIMSEVAHRCERYGQVIAWSEVAMGEILAACPGGNSAGLLRVASSSKPNQLAAATTAVLAIWMPAVRRANRPPQVKEDYFQRFEPVIDALIASGQTYQRSNAFGTQGMFLEAERGLQAPELDDRMLARARDLREIAQSTRGETKRALATAPLVEMEYRRLLGEIEVAEQLAAVARELLIDFGLPRHLERMTQYRYLSFPR